jgi:sialidase-1
MLLRLSSLLALTLLTTASTTFPTDPVDLFVAGSPPEISNYRIPSLIRTAKGTLIAVAEARTAQADCCFKYLVFRRSTDNGTSWSPVETMFGSNLTDDQGAGNPVLVFDAVTGTTIIHGSVNDPTHCSPTVYTFQLDDGGSDGERWGNFLALTPYLGAYDGATPGPGTGTQILDPSSPYHGRLIVAAHYGAYEDDVSWFSDDHGKTWNLSAPVLPHLDEVVVVALPSGRVLLNARTDHYNASCDCRAVTHSDDGGATWATPVLWDATLIEPVCQASLVTVGPLPSNNNTVSLFFSNPASTTDRANLTVRRSDDEGATWSPATWLVHAGEMWGGYSCIAPGAPLTRADAGGGAQLSGAIVWERARPVTAGSQDTTTVISFALFPLDPPSPRPRTFVGASSPFVAWQGRRVVNPADGSVSFDFSGVTATLSLQGASYIEAQYLGSCTTPRLESDLDGVPPLDTDAAGSFWLYSSFAFPHTLTLFKNISGGGPADGDDAVHTLRIRAGTEARWGGCGDGSDAPQTVTFAGIWTDGVPVSPPAAPSRQIEWVGDSITAGFGAAPKPGGDPCPSSEEVQDISRAAPMLVCASLGAACSVVAVSGDTVLTPPPPGPAADKPPLPLIYPRALTYDPDALWNFSLFVPDAIVVALGTNDVADPNFGEAYVPSLVAFLLQLASAGGYYSAAGAPKPPRALLYCGPMNFTYCGPMQVAVQDAVAAGADAVFLGPVNATLDGCDGHPGPVGQAQMATQLADLIKGAMGW